MHMLKDKYVDEGLVKRLSDEAKTDIEILRKAVERLRWAEIPVGTDEELRKVSDSDVDARIDKAISDYQAEAKRMLLADDLLAEALRRYEQCRNELKGHVATIHRLLKKYEGVHVKFDSKSNAWWNEKELQECMATKSTHFYSDVDKGLYQRLGVVVDALNDLIRYEKQQQLVHVLEKEVSDPYNAIYGLYDREAKVYSISRERYDRMVKAGFAKQHEPSEEEIAKMEHILRHGF